jgi:hypothetical protein
LVRVGVGPFLSARSRHSGRKSLRTRCSYNGRVPAQCTCYVSMILNSRGPPTRILLPEVTCRTSCTGTGPTLTAPSSSAPRWNSALHSHIRESCTYTYTSRCTKTNKFHHSDSSPGLGQVGDYKGYTPSADRGSPCTCTVTLNGPTPISARGVRPIRCRFRRTVRHRGREALPPQRSEEVRSFFFPSDMISMLVP